jgi:hypothetical protein
VTFTGLIIVNIFSTSTNNYHALIKTTIES